MKRIILAALVGVLVSGPLAGCQLTQRTPEQREAYQIKRHCQDVGQVASAQMRASQKPLTGSVGQALAQGRERSAAYDVAYRECMWSKGYKTRR